MDNSSGQIDFEKIKQIDEHWHWNVSNLMKSDSVKYVKYFECDMYIRLIIVFDEFVRVDEYKKNDDIENVSTLLFDKNDVNFMRLAFKSYKGKKPDTWNKLLKRIGAKDS